MKILILVNKVTNRLQYIFGLLLEELLGLAVEFTTDRDAFIGYEGYKLHYGDAPIADEVFQKATRLLFERDVRSQELRPFDFSDVKAIFPVYHVDSIMPFDVFSASFFLVSRYEEYLPHVRDHYGRYMANDTFMYSVGMLQKPLVNIWAVALGEALREKMPALTLKKRSFKFVPTYDIDAAWAYKNKGIFRTIGGFAKNLLQGDFAEMCRRYKVLLGQSPDPFDTFDIQFELQKKYKLRPLYFVLCGNYDTHDKNISIRNTSFQNLIKRLGDYADVGIHPSFSSYLDGMKLKKEKENLENVLNCSVTKSRQHFLKMNLPQSYQKLVEMDITDDYTMGFASQPGFRAGIADTFSFYDLDMDADMHLRVHPFALMDGTMRDYLNLGIEPSYAMATQLIDEVKKVNGTFILLWHNETLSDEKRWKGWTQLYQRIVDYAMTR